MGNGLFFATGNVWTRHRKIVSAAFHWDVMKEITPQVEKIAVDHF